jgi:uncharacterized protein DUF5694
VRTSLAVVSSLLCWLLLGPQGSRPAPAVASAGLDPAARTRVLVLASPHLSSLDKPLDPKALDSLVSLLVAFRPSVVAVEAMPAWLLAALGRREGNDATVVEQFASERLAVGRRIGEEEKLAPEAAQAKCREQLRGLGRDADVGARLRGIRTCLAAYEETTAILQWSYVPESVRATTESLPADVRAHLSRRLADANETSSIAIRVASRVGLNSIADVDDQRESSRILEIGPALQKELDASPASRAAIESTIYRESTRRLSEAVEGKDLLPYYRWLNSFDYQRADLDSQWGLFFRTRLKSGLDRVRTAEWEFRNLSMVANVREASATCPGGNVLVVVGAAHKPFFDAYLSQLMDVSVVDLSDLESGGAKR